MAVVTAVCNGQPKKDGFISGRRQRVGTSESGSL